ncbi:Na(+)/H(+) exchange regulatory cofactor NHE-RF1-like [Liolophura sinensis]|uniref:Na(+)/H(+) exchange regulatory cofactor NHE-RF1-like n=1 Tax=Liolophura sinensis TaxID=3198878 RepID=UPI0031593F52
MGDGAKYQPRLCTLSKWAHFNGYGFNLHAERGKAGQYIGKVDAGSPAEAAGLKQGDRIVEVDGMNIGNENHQQVVSRIKAGGNKTSLLVVDSETDKYFKDQRVVVRSDMPEVLKLSSEQPRPAGSDTNEETGENGELNGVTSADIETNGQVDLDSDNEEISAVNTSQVEAAPEREEPESAIAEFTIPPPPTDDPEPEHNREPSPEPAREPSPEPAREPSPEPAREPSPEPIREPSPEPVRDPTPEPVRAPTPEPVREPTPEPVREPTPEPVREPTPEPVRAPTPEPVQPPKPEPQTNGAQANGDPLMRMSAKEMREQLAAKKKADAKSKKIGFKDKYDIFQRL